MPFLQLLGLPEHELPAVQLLHAPLPSQTSLVPQLVPAGSGVASTQVCVPVVHDVVPVSQAALGLLEHALPLVHDTHDPPLHTRFVPQLVPAFFCVPSTQTDVPVEQLVVPL
jgi:hypothetical protein